MPSPEQGSAPDCIFCRIVKGEIPSTRIYEDETLLVFLDINPVAAGHCLIIPKEHHATLCDMPQKLAAPVMSALARIGKAVMAATGAGGFNCLQNNFAAAGQVVFHTHWHIIPRFAGDGLTHWPHAPYADKAAMEQVAEALRRELA